MSLELLKTRKSRFIKEARSHLLVFSRDGPVFLSHVPFAQRFFVTDFTYADLKSANVLFEERYLTGMSLIFLAKIYERPVFL